MAAPGADPGSLASGGPPPTAKGVVILAFLSQPRGLEGVGCEGLMSQAQMFPKAPTGFFLVSYVYRFRAYEVKERTELRFPELSIPEQFGEPGLGLHLQLLKCQS